MSFRRSEKFIYEFSKKDFSSASLCRNDVFVFSEVTMEIYSAQNFLAYYEKIRQRTLRVINCIPPDKIEWTYKEGKFTFGDLIRHLAAIERYMFAENFQFKPSRYPGHSRELADGYETSSIS